MKTSEEAKEERRNANIGAKGRTVLDCDVSVDEDTGKINKRQSVRHVHKGGMIMEKR